MPVTNSIERGKWFSSVNYWLFPRELEQEALKRLAQFKKPAQPNVTVYSAADFSKPLVVGTATTQEIEEYEKGLGALRNEIYNAQPLWHLYDVHLRVNAGVEEFVAEFVDFSGKGAREFNWPNRVTNSRLRWREHGWKHISYREITDHWASYHSGWIAWHKAELIGSDDQVRALISAAANNDPEAVGKIWALFPTIEQQGDLLITFFGPDREDWPTIPHPADIAARLVRPIYESPESEEAEMSRRILRRLISASATKGESGQRGRPRTKVPPAILRLLWKMSYCEIAQFREVVEFLARRKISDVTRSMTLLTVYPWIRTMVGEKPEDIVSLEPNRAALLMVGRLTGVSTSALEKMGLRSRE